MRTRAPAAVPPIRPGASPALEAQAAELEDKAKDLRGRIASLKLKTQPAEPAPKDTPPARAHHTEMPGGK